MHLPVTPEPAQPANSVDLVEVPDQLRPRGVQVAISEVGLQRLVDDLEDGVDDLVDRIDGTFVGLSEIAARHLRRPVPVRTGMLR